MGIWKRSFNAATVGSYPDNMPHVFGCLSNAASCPIYLPEHLPVA